MEQIVKLGEWLNQSPWLNLLFLIIAVISLLASFLFYLKARKEIKPCFGIKSFQLISESVSNIEDIDIIFKGVKIANLSTTKIAFWNEGRSTLNKSDVAQSDPLRVSISDDLKFLKAALTYQTKKANNCSIGLSDDNKEIILDFDYFHTNQGVIIEAFHTGDAKVSIAIKGSIKSAPHIINKMASKSPISDAVFHRLVPKWLDDYTEKHEWAAMLAVIAYIPIIIPFVVADQVLSPMRRIPKEFELR